MDNHRTICNTSKKIYYGRDIFGFAYDKANDSMVKEYSFYSSIDDIEEIIEDTKQKINELEYKLDNHPIGKKSITKRRQIYDDIMDQKNILVNQEINLSYKTKLICENITKGLIQTNVNQNKFQPNYVYERWNYLRDTKAQNLTFNFE